MKSRVSSKNETRATKWLAHIEAWRGSGLSQVAYCRDHGISQSSLKYWIRRLNAPPQPMTLPSIVEIAPVAAIRALQLDPEPAPLSLRIAGRYQLDIREDFPSLVLEKVVRTLERL